MATNTNEVPLAHEENTVTTEEDIAEIIHPTADGVFLSTVDEMGYIRLADVQVFRYNRLMVGLEAVLRGEGPEEERTYGLWNCQSNESEEWLGKLFKALGNLTPTSTAVGPIRWGGVLKSCPKIHTLIDEREKHKKRLTALEKIEAERGLHLLEKKWLLYHRLAIQAIDKANDEHK